MKARSRPAYFHHPPCDQLKAERQTSREWTKWFRRSFGSKPAPGITAADVFDAQLPQRGAIEYRTPTVARLPSRLDPAERCKRCPMDSLSLPPPQVEENESRYEWPAFPIEYGRDLKCVAKV